VSADSVLSRRSVLLGAAAAAAGGRTRALWREAWRRGIVFGSSTATWKISDKEYARVFDREAAMLFTEDDLLWYRLKPKPESRLRFRHGDEIVRFAKRRDQLVFAAHLVWDEGFGKGWSDDYLRGLEEREARRLLYGTIRREVRHYRGQVAAWVVANEVTDPDGRNGFRTDVPWWNTIGRDYIADSFHIAHEEDPLATLVINEFGFETVTEDGDKASARRKAMLQVLDTLLDQGVPVHALGTQGHLLADRFEQRFHAREYRAFLREVADRGLKILVTEMDVLDDGLPPERRIRDRAVADVYRRYLDVTLDETAVKALICFGLSDRYTWLEEDYPRDDGAARRPLLYNRRMQPKPAHRAVAHSLYHAPRRRPLWDVPRSARHPG